MAEAKKKTEIKKEAKNKDEKTKKSPDKKAAKKEAKMKKEEIKYEGDPYDVIKFVLMTEKAVRFIELQNRLVFVVDRKARKDDIRKAVEAAFKTKASDVNVLIDQKGRKRAFVKFEKPGEAGEIAIRLGII